MFGLFFNKGIKEKTKHDAQCNQHNAVLNHEGLYDKSLSVHTLKDEAPNTRSRLPSKKGSVGDEENLVLS